MAKLNYTSRDYAAVLAEMRARSQTVFPDWTDFNEANAGNALLGSFALAAEILNANQDAQFNECFWDSARHRRSIISLAKLVGYRLASARPAQVDIQAIIPATAGGVTIPKGTSISSAGLQPVRIFELQADMVIPAGQTTGTAPAKHADTKTNGFTANGTIDQRFRLSWGPHLDGSARVVVDGANWTEVENFVGSRPADAHFVVEVDENDIGTIVFSDGVLGAVPTGAVTVTYEIGGGVIGNVPANTLTVLDGAFTDSIGAGVQVRVTNPQAATGGQERESIKRARKLAPNKPKDTGRTISREDYEQNSLIDGVVRAKAVSQAELGSLAMNQTGVYIVAAWKGTPSVVPGGLNLHGFPSQQQKDAVRQTLLVDKPIPLGWDVVVLNPIFEQISVYVTITAQPGVDRAVLKTDAENAIVRWFDPARTDAPEDDPWQDRARWTGAGAYALNWGMTIYPGRFLALMFQDPQARVFNASVTYPESDITCAPLQFPGIPRSLTVVVN